LEVVLPKWSFDADLDLKMLLPGLRLTAPFRDGADLSGIATVEPLVVDQAIQKATVAVDERGTIATAATGVVGIGLSGPAPAQVHFVVDRPFAFEILDLRTGAPLFLGSVLDLR
jgi:serpin B